MDIIKILTAVTTATAQIQQAMSDKELTLKEICDIVDSTLKSAAGVGLDKIGVKMEKVNGKTKLILVFGEKEIQ